MRLFIAKTKKGAMILTDCMGYGILKINDEVVKTQEKQIILPDSKFSYRVRTENNIISYEDTETGLSCSVEERTKVYDETHTEDRGYIDFESEIRWRKFARNLVEIIETKEIWAEPEITYYYVDDVPDNPYIKCYPLFSKKYISPDKLLANGEYYVYEPNDIEMFKMVVKSYECIEVDIPNHSGLRFIKVNGHYVFNDRFDSLHPRRFITLEQAHKLYDEDIERLHERIDLGLALSSSKKITEVGQLLRSLRALDEQVITLDVKVKDRDSKKQIRTKLRKLIDNLM